MFIDSLADGIRIENPNFSQEEIDEIALLILQAARVRISRTEYIACPSCGRTQYDIQRALKEIKEKTRHLVGVKIGVMGCIVNGPGEMADADYGYVGSGAGKITLYKGKAVVKRDIDQKDAVDELVKFIENDRK
jgi:(E)-4-hydroxy-3-methylbut-2-enyl-diphosphate synthase